MVQLVRRPRYADVVGTLALIVALSGTAYAAVELPRDSVGAKQIRDRAVRSSEIKDGQVKAVDLANGSVGTVTLQPSSVSGAAVQDESVTLADIKGADVTGPISVSVGAASCGGLNLQVVGLETGQSAFLSLVGPSTSDLMFGPLQVTATGQATTRLCNFGSAFSGTLTVHVVSFG